MNINQILTESAPIKGSKGIQAAASRILSEDITSGQTVAVIDDPISGYSGAKGKVRTISDSNPGFADVELENGTTVKMQTSLLVPV